jgi:DNA-binding transcriptional regulator LsrR (DeoR family)
MTKPAKHSRRELALMHRAARLYYVEEINQAGIAERLTVSRPTVSRLLAEARRIGLVQITVHDPEAVVADEKLERLAEALGLARVWIAPFSGGGGGDGIGVGGALAEQVGNALGEADLVAGDVLLVSSGRTVYELSMLNLPRIPGLDICPTVGGVAEPEAWHQTNEITRLVAERMKGQPHFLFAQAMPSVPMRATLVEDPEFQRVTGMWQQAKAALVGVGAPPVSRSSISRSVPLADQGLRTAVGDVCLNFYDVSGRELEFPGSDRMVRISPAQLRRIPHTIAVAVGANKVDSVIAAARAELFNRLVTDVPTAELLLNAVSGGSGIRTG